MKKYLFDTNAISLILNNNTPKKWSDVWRFIRMGERGIIFIEPLISEIYYKNARTFGMKVMKDKILGLKNYPNAEIYPLEDNDAIAAGDIKIKYRPLRLSLVDCFILHVAKKCRATIFTTDPGIKNVGRELKIDVNFIPFGK